MNLEGLIDGMELYNVVGTVYGTGTLEMYAREAEAVGKAVWELTKNTAVLVYKLVEGTTKAVVEISNHAYGAGREAVRIAGKIIDSQKY